MWTYMTSSYEGAGRNLLQARCEALGAAFLDGLRPRPWALSRLECDDKP